MVPHTSKISFDGIIVFANIVRKITTNLNRIRGSITLYYINMFMIIDNHALNTNCPAKFDNFEYIYIFFFYILIIHY